MSVMSHVDALIRDLDVAIDVQDTTKAGRIFRELADLAHGDYDVVGTWIHAHHNPGSEDLRTRLPLVRGPSEPIGRVLKIFPRKFP